MQYNFIDGKNPCPNCRRKLGRDVKGDNFFWYGNGKGGRCFSCGWQILSDEYKLENGIGINDNNDDELEESDMSGEFITKEEVDKLKSYTGTTFQMSRKIKDETFQWYGCRSKFDEESGEITDHFYPFFENGVIAGFKRRKLPKQFSIIGKVGSSSELFGYFRYKNSNSKICIIASGEIDAMSARQMLVDYNKGRGSTYEETPVVAPSTGEGSSVKQLKAHYEWFDKFEKIILIYDNDDAGLAATEKAVKVLPKGKVFVTQFNAKDVGELLEKGREKEFINAFFKARAYTAAGIVGSDTLYDKLKGKVGVVKLPFPDFMPKLQEATAGGIPLGSIVNILAGSGIGKTTVVDSLVHFWLFNSPYKIGVISLEADAATYAQSLLSHHIGRKLALIEDALEYNDYLESDFVKAKSKELFECEDGSPRFYLVDERGEFDKIEEKIEELIRTCDVQIVVIDVLSDVMSGMDISSQELFMTWQKQIIKSHNMTFININHTRKGKDTSSSASKGAEITEEDIIGSSTIYKSASMNITLVRDKSAEDEILRNTTKVALTKNRGTGQTGPMGAMYYDKATHRLHDFDTWLAEHGPQDY